jgi:hypothetical protein
VGAPGEKLETVELKNKIAVVLDNPGLLFKEAACRKKPVILYLDGQATGNTIAVPASPQDSSLVFFLRQTNGVREFWNALLGRPDFEPRPVNVSVGVEGQPPLASDSALKLNVLPWKYVLGWMVVFIALAIIFYKSSRNSWMLRDQLLDPATPDQLGAYSLSKVQGAWWFFIILASYLLIGIVTGDTSNSINSTALILLGIGAGTVLGSAAIDASKLDQRKADLGTAKTALASAATDDAKNAAQAKIDALNGKSVGFLADILSDGNGVNFHRFQLAAWTFVLSVIFITEVYVDLAMPTFNTTLMGLVGLSAGTYLGLKIPEPTKPTP